MLTVVCSNAFCKEQQQESNYTLANIEWGEPGGRGGGESVNCELPRRSELPLTVVPPSTPLILPTSYHLGENFPFFSFWLTVF